MWHGSSMSCSSGSWAAAGTPFWKLVLKQFDDYLVKILIAAAVVDLIIALANGERGAGCVVKLIFPSAVQGVTLRPTLQQPGYSSQSCYRSCCRGHGIM